MSKKMNYLSGDDLAKGGKLSRGPFYPGHGEILWAILFLKIKLWPKFQHPGQFYTHWYKICISKEGFCIT